LRGLQQHASTPIHSPLESYGHATHSNHVIHVMHPGSAPHSHIRQFAQPRFHLGVPRPIETGVAPPAGGWYPLLPLMLLYYIPTKYYRISTYCTLSEPELKNLRMCRMNSQWTMKKPPRHNLVAIPLFGIATPAREYFLISQYFEISHIIGKHFSNFHNLAVKNRRIFTQVTTGYFEYQVVSSFIPVLT
jgi:hypothetical protein